VTIWTRMELKEAGNKRKGRMAKYMFFYYLFFFGSSSILSVLLYFSFLSTFISIDN